MGGPLRLDMRTVGAMKRFVPFLLAILALAAPGPGRAETAAWVTSGPVEARLVASVQGVGDLAKIPLGLEVRLEPGWKTYWRTPGDAGFAPRLDWSESRNLKAADLIYPAPHRFTVLGFETAGYDAEVLFPIAAIPAEPGKPLDLALKAELLVCSTICVPEMVALSLSIPEGPATPGPSANDIARAQSLVPGDGRASGLTVTAVRGQGAVLEVEVTAREPMVAPDVFVETDPPVTFAAPKSQFLDGDRRAILRMDATDPTPGLDLAGRAMTLTVVDGNRSVEAPATAAAGLGGGAGAAPAGLLAMLGVALLGGLILNLMPCVLPVLSLKLLSIVQHGGRAPAAVRAGFLASAAGILTSFLILAGALVAVKAAGGAVGWGIQFQQPLFLVFMVVLVTLFAANLWGLFELPLPRAVADRLGGPEGQGLGGQFATGAFATLLATPCSAPFLGTAVGYALSRGALEVFAIFAALGVGLALPYLLIAAFPRAARLLPRPGRWMVALRRVLGGALALTALWLLSVLVVQVGEVPALAVAVLMGGLVAALWLGRRLAETARWAGAALAGLLALVAFAVPAVFGPSAGAAPVAEDTAARWVVFDEAAIREQVAAGRTVFVDVTADWCITCQANKKLVLNRGTVAQRLEDAGAVTAMRADWTRPDETIARYLARHGRYGIPFNIVYGPGAPEGIALPELLTEGAVLDALDRASGKIKS